MFNIDTLPCSIVREGGIEPTNFRHPKHKYLLTGSRTEIVIQRATITLFPDMLLMYAIEYLTLSHKGIRTRTM